MDSNRRGMALLALGWFLFFSLYYIVTGEWVIGALWATLAGFILLFLWRWNRTGPVGA